MIKYFALTAVAGLLAACGSNGSQGGSGQQIKIVGSSTVYPFTKALAEDFQRATAGSSVIVESTAPERESSCSAWRRRDFPDIVNASRPMKEERI